MRRDKTLAKEILEVIVGKDNGGGGLYRREIHAVFDEHHPNPDLAFDDALEYHLLLLESAGFVRLTESADDRETDNFEMTWAGHDFLEDGSED